MANVILYSIFGILFTIGGSLWAIVEIIQYFPQTLGGFFMFALCALVILYLARAMMKNFLESAHA